MSLSLSCSTWNLTLSWGYCFLLLSFLWVNMYYTSLDIIYFLLVLYCYIQAILSTFVNNFLPPALECMPSVSVFQSHSTPSYSTSFLEDFSYFFTVSVSKITSFVFCLILIPSHMIFLMLYSLSYSNLGVKGFCRCN